MQNQIINRPWLESLLVWLLVAVLSFTVAAVVAETRTGDWAIDQANSSCLFATVAAAIFFRLRTTYFSTIGGIAVLSLLSLPSLFQMAIGPPGPLWVMTLVILAWGIWPIVHTGILGSVVWLVLACYAAVFVHYQLGISALQCYQIPEWHWVFAIIGFGACLRRWRHDPQAVYIVFSSLVLMLVLQGPIKLVMFAPIIGVGAGKLFFRGTLTKPFRIPPATWAVVLFTVATVRSVVIMVVWAPHWSEYQNRVGLFVEQSNL